MVMQLISTETHNMHFVVTIHSTGSLLLGFF